MRKLLCACLLALGCGSNAETPMLTSLHEADAASEGDLGTTWPAVHDAAPDADAVAGEGGGDTGASDGDGSVDGVVTDAQADGSDAGGLDGGSADSAVADSGVVDAAADGGGDVGVADSAVTQCPTGQRPQTTYDGSVICVCATDYLAACEGKQCGKVTPTGCDVVYDCGSCSGCPTSGGNVCTECNAQYQCSPNNADTCAAQSRNCGDLNLDDAGAYSCGTCPADSNGCGWPVIGQCSWCAARGQGACPVGWTAWGNCRTAPATGCSGPDKWGYWCCP